MIVRKEHFMIDRFTKVCLTVIAVSLAVIGLRGLPMVDPAWAQGGIQKIAICNENGSGCAGINAINRLKIDN